MRRSFVSVASVFVAFVSVAFLAAGWSAAGCSEPAPVECKTASECNLHPLGACVAAISGRRWCAYEGAYAEGCGSGGRWSLEAGDGLAGQCVQSTNGADAGIDAAGDAGPQHTLSVSVLGAGMVTSMPIGISCGVDCDERYDEKTVVTLTAASQAGATFVGWGGACAGVRAAPTCELAMSAERAVSARFEPPGSVVERQLTSGPGVDAVSDVVADRAGNTYVVGTFETQVTLGSETVLGFGGVDVFVAKFGPNGQLAWAKAFGGSLDDQGNAIALDSAGRVWIAGAFANVINFGGGMLTAAGGLDVFLVALDGANGQHVRSSRFGTTADQIADDLACGPSDEVVVVGNYTTAIDFGGGSMTTVGTISADAFIAKFSGAGVYQWQKRFGSGSFDSAQAVAISGAGRVAIGGRFEGEFDLGGGPTSAKGFTDGLVAVLGSDGAHVWSRGLGGVMGELVAGVGFDASGNLIAVGSFGGTIDLGGGPLVALGGADLFATKMNSVDGGHVWAKRFGGSGLELPRGATVDATGGIIFTGWFDGSADFGGTILGSAGNHDAFASRVDAAGSVVWAKRFGGTLADEAAAAAWDGQNGIVVVGRFAGTAMLGGEMVTAAGGSDGFAVTLAR
jgi:hypothetical protein